MGAPMIALHPDPDEGPIDPLHAVAAEDRGPLDGRPWVMTNMIASADGATAVDGRSGELGGPADFAMFKALRAIADVIVVGASTVREERYQVPGTGGDEQQQMRATRGQAPRPLIVIITAGLDLDPTLPLFTEPGYRPLILTGASAPEDRRERLSQVAEVVTAGNDGVDLATAMAELGGRGHRVALAEGGPSLNGQLIAEDLIDEWNLSVSPLLVSGPSDRPAHGRLSGGPPRQMKLARVWMSDDLLFCRWIRNPRPA